MRSAAILAVVVGLLVGCGPIHSYSEENVKPIRIARPCERSQLVPRLNLEGATGKLVGGVTFRVEGNRRCSVFPMPPQVRLIGGSQRVQVYEIDTTVPSELRGSRPQSLRPGDRVAIDLEWSNWCATPPPALVIPIRFSGEYRLRPTATPPCQASGRPSRIGVGPVVPIR